MNIQYTLDRDNQESLHTLLEDTVAQWCDEHLISGQLAWLVAQSYSTARLEQFRSNRK